MKCLLFSLLLLPALATYTCAQNLCDALRTNTENMAKDYDLVIDPLADKPKITRFTGKKVNPAMLYPLQKPLPGLGAKQYLVAEGSSGIILGEVAAYKDARQATDRMKAVSASLLSCLKAAGWKVKSTATSEGNLYELSVSGTAMVVSCSIQKDGKNPLVVYMIAPSANL